MNFPEFPHQGLYFHFPFCSKRCNYCSFYSGNFNLNDKNNYLKSMIEELKRRKDELSENIPITTIYYGGGTPSLVDSDMLCDFTQEVFNSLCSHNISVSEFTIEVNPEDVNIHNIRKWKEMGVNRVSIGIQSFDDNLLKIMNRRHDCRQAICALELLRENFDNISSDLIFALPGETMQILDNDLRIMTNCNPDHISAYMLTFEPRTVLTYRRDKGEFIIDEDLQGEMYAHIIEELGNKGYSQYEISNFAKPAKQSLHNSSYWSGNPYLGIGTAAHSYDGKRKRSWVDADLRSYIRYYIRGDNAMQHQSLIEFEMLDDFQLLEEYVMLRLRTNTGINMEDMKCRFSAQMVYKFKNECEKERKIFDTLRISESQISLNQLGRLMSDGVVLRLLSKL